MHTFRLLNMAEEIALHKQVMIHCHDREFLLSIRRGEYEYDDLLKMAEEKLAYIEMLYGQCDLPDAPDVQKAEALLIEIREGVNGVDSCCK